LSELLYGSGEKSKAHCAFLKRCYELYNCHLDWRGIGVSRLVDCHVCAMGMFAIACVFGISITLIGASLIADGFAKN
jgi:hypothetical protein